MVTHTQNLCSAFNPSARARAHARTHARTHTHTRSSGFGVLLKGLTSVMVLKVEESAGYSLQNQNGLIIETV